MKRTLASLLTLCLSLSFSIASEATRSFQFASISENTIQKILRAHGVLELHPYRVTRNSNGTLLSVLCSSGSETNRSTILTTISTNGTIVSQHKGILFGLGENGEPLSWRIGDDLFFSTGDKVRLPMYSLPRFTPGGRFYTLFQTNRATLFLTKDPLKPIITLANDFHPQILFDFHGVIYVFGAQVDAMKARKNRMIRIRASERGYSVSEETELKIQGEAKEVSPDGKTAFIRTGSEIFQKFEAYDLEKNIGTRIKSVKSYNFFLHKNLVGRLNAGAN